jgi:hypothetical protein
VKYRIGIVFTFIMLAGAALPARAASKESYVLWKAYIDCLGSKALALEPSGAAPDDLIKAAVTSCSGPWADALDKMEAEFSADDPATAGTRAMKMLNEGSETKKDEIRLQVLEMRARRKQTNAPNQ